MVSRTPSQPEPNVMQMARRKRFSAEDLSSVDVKRKQIIERLIAIFHGDLNSSPTSSSSGGAVARRRRTPRGRSASSTIKDTGPDAINVKLQYEHTNSNGSDLCKNFDSSFMCVNTITIHNMQITSSIVIHSEDIRGKIKDNFVISCDVNLIIQHVR